MANAIEFNGEESTTNINRSTGEGINILGQKGRLWMAVINNPEKYGVDNSLSAITSMLAPLCDAGRVTFLAGIMENSLSADENGVHTPHLHIVIYAPHQIRGSQLHKSLPHAALQLCNGSAQSVIQYIRKDCSGQWYKNHPEKLAEKLPESEAGFWTWGVMPTEHRHGQSQAGKGGQDEQLIKAIIAGKSDADIYQIIPGAWRRPDALRRVRFAIMSQKYRAITRPITCIYVETYFPYQNIHDLYPHSPDVYVVSDYNRPWDGYSAEHTVVFLNYIGQFSWFDLTRYLSGNYCTLPARFADGVACYTTIIIISPLSPKELCETNKNYTADFLEHYLTHYRLFQSQDDLGKDYIRDSSGRWHQQFLLTSAIKKGGTKNG